MDGYIFSWESINGRYHEIKITPRTNFSGSWQRRNLGGAPLLRYEVSDGIIGSSLNFLAECEVNREFSRLYTSDPYEYAVELYEFDTLPSGVVMWRGFIVPETYSEPDIAPPYDVSLMAVDGLGELKQAVYEHSGNSLFAVFRNVLHAAQDEDLPIYSRIMYTNAEQTTAGNFLVNTSVDLSDRSGDSCYDVLKGLLETFHLRIMYRNGALIRSGSQSVVHQPGWYIFNENDLLTGGDIEFYRDNGTGKLTLSRESFGPMGTCGWWPVDHLTTELDAACNGVTVRAKTEYTELAQDSDCSSGSASIWDVTSPATYQPELDKDSPGHFDIPAISSPVLRSGKVSQTIHLYDSVTDDLRLTFRVKGFRQVPRGSSVSGYTEGQLLVTVEGMAGGSSFYLDKPEDCEIGVWKAGETSVVLDYPATTRKGDPAEVSLILPFDPSTSEGSPSGAAGIQTLVVTVSNGIPGARVWLYGLSLQVDGEGRTVETRISLTNNARGSQEDHELLVPFIKAGDTRTNLKRLMAHVPFKTASGGRGGAGIYSWGDGKDFQEYIGLEYAKTFALPRCRKTGVLNSPAACKLPPMVLRSETEGLDYGLLAFDWDMLNDEVSLTEMVELPGGQLGPSGWVLGDLLPMILRS